jgi:Na+:H+ antiporter, NhaA family
MCQIGPMSTAHTTGNFEIKASLILLAATVLALIVANSPLFYIYKDVLNLEIGFDAGPFDLSDTVKAWIKNALMAVFFLYVGLEIKAEFREGALSDRSRAILPFIGALGGMALPAAVYLAATSNDATLARGWAIPSATDIAFAVGVIGFLGARIPAALKALLLAIAIIDDLGAILIIAVFYTAEIHWWALGFSAIAIAAMWFLNSRNDPRLWPYLALGAVLWLFMLQSGVNATLAGVIAALFVPMRRAIGDATSASPLKSLEHALKFSVAFVIMPLFAFANAGVPLLGISLADMAQPLTLGIALGLAVGKPIGITLALAAVVLPGYARLPDGIGWIQVAGMGCIAGIGFTMSLFIGILAFGEGPLLDQVRLGVLSGSLLSAILGAAILIAASKK